MCFAIHECFLTQQPQAILNTICNLSSTSILLCLYFLKFSRTYFYFSILDYFQWCSSSIVSSTWQHAEIARSSADEGAHQRFDYSVGNLFPTRVTIDFQDVSPRTLITLACCDLLHSNQVYSTRRTACQKKSQNYCPSESDQKHLRVNHKGTLWTHWAIEVLLYLSRLCEKCCMLPVPLHRNQCSDRVPIYQYSPDTRWFFDQKLFSICAQPRVVLFNFVDFALGFHANFQKIRRLDFQIFYLMLL